MKKLEAFHGVLDTCLLVGVGGRAVDRGLLGAHRGYCAYSDAVPPMDMTARW